MVTFAIRVVIVILVLSDQFLIINTDLHSLREESDRDVDMDRQTDRSSHGLKF